jgi:cell division protein ZapA
MYVKGDFMAKKNTAEVLINGKIYTISGYESTAYLHKVATFLNELEEDISKTENYNMLSPDEKQLLKNMNLADVYFKANDAREELEHQVEDKDREIYSLKHDLIDARLEKDKLLQQIKELETKLAEEQKRRIRAVKSTELRKLRKPEQRL